jgi:hypothetical protein
MLRATGTVVGGVPRTHEPNRQAYQTILIHHFVNGEPKLFTVFQKRKPKRVLHPTRPNRMAVDCRFAQMHMEITFKSMERITKRISLTIMSRITCIDCWMWRRLDGGRSFVVQITHASVFDLSWISDPLCGGDKYPLIRGSQSTHDIGTYRA